MKEPIYKVIERYLKELIDTKKLNEGDLLPSENQLCEKFNVTRMTVRGALNNLVADGYIIKKRGIGSVVISSKIYDNISKVSGFTKEMTSKGVKVETIVKELNIIEADNVIAEKLNLNLGENVWKIVRVRIANDIRVSCMITYMPVKLFQNLNRKHCEGSLYYYIEEICGFKIVLAERCVEAILATKDLKKFLALSGDIPLLHIEQVSKLEDSEIFEYSHTFHYNYKLTLNAVNE